MRVSILSAVHNEQKHLPAMIESVRAQSHADWELVLVDDGSTDNTRAVIAGAASSDARIKEAGNGAKIGKVAAFNTAYEACTGDLVVLLGGDDLLPPESLAVRANALSPFAPDQMAIGRFKLRTLSSDPKMDGTVLPRSKMVSASGGVMAMTRAVSNVAFPIDESLVSEDLWLGAVAEDVAVNTVDVPEVVLEYRIHPGNSNPRNKDFWTMSEAMASRHRAWAVLAGSENLMSAEGRTKMAQKARLEELRRNGRVLRILSDNSASLSERLAFASMSNAKLFAVRQRFYMLLSGRRM